MRPGGPGGPPAGFRGGGPPAGFMGPGGRMFFLWVIRGDFHGASFFLYVVCLSNVL